MVGAPTQPFTVVLIVLVHVVFISMSVIGRVDIDGPHWPSVDAGSSPIMTGINGHPHRVNETSVVGHRHGGRCLSCVFAVITRRACTDAT